MYLSAVWDGAFKSLSAELCGNTSDYQIGIVSEGDTSNCLNIGRIQSERVYNKCLIISCIRFVINEIHAEWVVVLSISDREITLRSGLEYINVLVNIGNAVINQIIHDCLTNGVAPDGSTLSATNSSVIITADYIYFQLPDPF
ncbi:hypothetical protein [Klebsiella michiganensis]|uniref:hypothetical protein n=1 Tax=Klebsiella michiganensis TaxID=1134687 RepID=UPI0013A58B28|nr:hypothetical protein [Klebsiella michiganensis]